MLTTETVRILDSRGIDPEVAARMGISDHEQKGGGKWISIPYFVAGKAVNHKYRTIEGEKRFYQDGESKKCFWNFDCLTDTSLQSEPLIITEGEFDAIIALQCGYPLTVSVPDGAPPVPVGIVNGDPSDSPKYSYVTDALATLKPIKEIILATDGDAPGGNLQQDLMVRLGRSRCKYVTYPPATKDLNEVFQRYGADGVHRLIKSAKYFKVDGVYRMGDLPPVKEKTPYKTGFASLDNHFRVRLGDFIVLTGIPSMGKSTWLNDLSCRLVDQWGWTIAFASFEQSPQSDHKHNLRQWKARKPPQHCTAEELENIDRWIDDHFSFIVPSDDDFASLEWLLLRMEAAVVQHGASVVVIDPWNEIEHEKPTFQSMTEYVNSAIRMLKRFAKAFNVTVIVAAHPTKLSKDHKGNIPVPTLYDISDSSAWFNKPDVGIIVHRSEGLSMIKIAKVRYHQHIGIPGTVWFQFNTDTGRFMEAVDPAEL